MKMFPENIYGQHNPPSESIIQGFVERFSNANLDLLRAGVVEKPKIS